jgi:hypothetical protein
MTLEKENWFKEADFKNYDLKRKIAHKMNLREFNFEVSKDSNWNQNNENWSDDVGAIHIPSNDANEDEKLENGRWKLSGWEWEWRFCYWTIY